MRTRPLFIGKRSPVIDTDVHPLSRTATGSQLSDLFHLRSLGDPIVSMESANWEPVRRNAANGYQLNNDFLLSEEEQDYLRALF